MDFNELKARLTNLNKKTTKNDGTWKPKDEHQVRLVQPAGEDEPFKTLHFHYELGDVMQVLCPKLNFDEDCPICEFAEKLRAWKGPDGEDKPEAERKADFEIFKKIQAKPRVFVPMIERGKEGNADSEESRWWGLSPNQFGQVLSVCEDGDRLEELGMSTGDSNATDVLFNPKKGYDLNVSFAKPGQKGNTKSFTQVTIKGRIKPSVLAKDEAQVEKLRNVKSIFDVFPKVSTDEIEKVLKKFIAGGMTEAEGSKDDGVDYKKGKKTNSNESAKMVGTRSIDDAFGDMVGEE